MAQKAVAAARCSICQACVTFSVSESCYRYRARLSNENAEIADLLVRLTHNQRNWGFGLCFLYLRNVKGYLEPQTCLPDLPGAGAEPAYQAS
jgi:putative transposase